MEVEPPRIDPLVAGWLESVFPDKCPNESDSDREIWMAVGAQRVLKKIRHTLNDQAGLLGEDDEEE